MSEDKKDYILLPKGTILDHYYVPNDKKRDYKWYYLAGQTYTNTCMQYRVKEDILLENYGLPKLMDRKTRKEINAGKYKKYDCS